MKQEKQNYPGFRGSSAFTTKMSSHTTKKRDNAKPAPPLWACGYLILSTVRDLRKTQRASDQCSWERISILDLDFWWRGRGRFKKYRIILPQNLGKPFACIFRQDLGAESCFALVIRAAFFRVRICTSKYELPLCKEKYL